MKLFRRFPLISGALGGGYAYKQARGQATRHVIAETIGGAVSGYATSMAAGVVAVSRPIAKIKWLAQPLAQMTPVLSSVSGKLEGWQGNLRTRAEEANQGYETSTTRAERVWHRSRELSLHVLSGAIAGTAAGLLIHKEQ